MRQPPIRRIPALMLAIVILVLGFTASICGAAAPGMDEPLGGSAQAAQLTVTDLLLFGLIGLAAGSAALAVRMVRRWH
jgi:hypothetical protein